MYIFHELAFIAVLFFAGHFFRVFEHEFRRAAAETKAIAAPGTTPCHRIIIQGSARILFALLIKSQSTDFEKGLNPTNGRIPDTSRSTALSDDDRTVISSRITTGRRPIATALKVHEVYLRSIRLLNLSSTLVSDYAFQFLLAPLVRQNCYADCSSLLLLDFLLNMVLISLRRLARFSIRSLRVILFKPSRILIHVLSRTGILPEVNWTCQESLNPIQPERSKPWHRRHSVQQAWRSSKGCQRAQRHARGQTTNEGKDDYSLFDNTTSNGSRLKLWWMLAVFQNQHL